MCSPSKLISASTAKEACTRRRRCGTAKAPIAESLHRERPRCVIFGVRPRGAQLRRTSVRHQEAGFVYEDDRRPATCGVFFTEGQSSRTQRRISRSSRSAARRAGFCGLQPSS